MSDQPKKRGRPSKRATYSKSMVAPSAKDLVMKKEGLYKKEKAPASTDKPDNVITSPVQRNVDPIIFQASQIRQRIEEVKKDLPHLYGWKWYKWAREFFESTNRVNLLCAANQVSKSSSAIRKNIEWACNKDLWPKIFPRRQPILFYYFLPSSDVATVEFETKWVPEFLPRGAMKDHPTYGWTAEYEGGSIKSIIFRSGVTLYFKSYGQKVINLQTATVDMITADEEIPEDLVDELLARLVATDGYFNMVFTATIGQPLWYRAMECVGTPEETFKHAWKKTISMLDCQVYEDGTEGAWPLARIQRRIQMCTSEAEIQRRVHGRFVRDEGRRYSAFAIDKNLAPQTEVPKTWKYYAGVDIGSGGVQRSAGSIAIIAVNPENTSCRLVRSWRGDVEETTVADIINRYLKLKEGIRIEQAAYDHGSREFALISGRLGVPFVPADKNHDSGIQIMNSLFKQRALMIDEDVYDNGKLVVELQTVPMQKTTNRKYKDDLSDALRYAVKLVPWDFEKIGFTPPEEDGRKSNGKNLDFSIPHASWTEAEHLAWQMKMRRGEIKEDRGEEGEFYLEDMIEAWNDEYGT